MKIMKCVFRNLGFANLNIQQFANECKILNLILQILQIAPLNPPSACGLARALAHGRRRRARRLGGARAPPPQPPRRGVPTGFSLQSSGRVLGPLEKFGQRFVCHVLDKL